MGPSPAALSLKLSGVSLGRGGRSILVGIDLTVEAGRTHLLFGANGAGKSSLLALAAGFEAPDAGEIQIGDRSVSRNGAICVPPHARRVAMVFQDESLWPHLNVEQHLKFGLRARVPSAAERHRRIEEALSFVGLQDRRHERPRNLSGGERQRVNLARALAQPAALYLLDEPGTHLDLRSRTPLLRRLAHMLRTRNATSLWVTHSLEEIELIGGQVSVLSAGRIEASMPAGSVRAWLAQSDREGT